MLSHPQLRLQVQLSIFENKSAGKSHLKIIGLACSTKRCQPCKGTVMRLWSIRAASVKGYSHRTHRLAITASPHWLSTSLRDCLDGPIWTSIIYGDGDTKAFDLRTKQLERTTTPLMKHLACVMPAISETLSLWRSLSRRHRARRCLRRRQGFHVGFQRGAIFLRDRRL